MKTDTVILLSIAFGMAIIAWLEWRRKPVTRKRYLRNIVDPAAHPPNPHCQSEPVSCETDADCQQCNDTIAMQCSEQQTDVKRGMMQKYCVPSQKPDRPCDVTKGGRWLYTGWGRIDHSIENDWECQCTFPTVAGRMEKNEGCGINHDVCRGGEWNDDSWEYSAPDPEKCQCPPDTIRIIRGGLKPMCLPKSTVCFDQVSCNATWNT